MRRAVNVALGLGIGVALGAYVGFPTREGLTKSRSRISMPGDLLLPGAKMQADRAATLAAPPKRAWALNADVKDLYEDMFGVPLDLVYEDAPNLAVWQTSSPLKEGDTELFQATVALTMTQIGEETEVHVRERYLTSGTIKGKIAVATEMVTSSILVPTLLRKNNRFLRTAPFNDNPEN